MGFSDLPFRERYKTLGDTAERVFIQLSEQGELLGTAVRVGWRRPDFDMRHMSETLKHFPDFYTERGWLVEVLGCGRDGILKLKKTKWHALKYWSKAQPTAFFVWNSAERRWVLAAYETIMKHVNRCRRRPDGEGEFTSDGKRYWALRWAELAADPDVVTGGPPS